MALGHKLNAEGESAWRRFNQHLKWAQGFALAFIFSADARVVSLFRERLADAFRARVTGLQSFDLERPEQLVEEVLPRLLAPLAREDALRAPCWLDLSQQRGVGWSRARLSLLARLNERRDVLRSKLGRPLLLVLPTSEKAKILTLVPDLWAIRDLTVETGAWVEEQHEPQLDLRGQIERRDLSGQDRLIVEEWQRLEKAGARDRGALLGSERAIEALRAAGQQDEALRVAMSAQSIALALAEAEETPEALRDLSVSLNNVGDAEQALGNWEGSRERYEQTLELRKRIIERVGETPEALRDLSISLNRMGDVERALGNWEGSRERYEQSLELCKRVIERVGETPEALRDLSISLNRMGDVERALGNWEGSRERYEQSLELCKRVIERVGETPEALRDLSVSLNNVGAAERALGNWEGGQALLLQALEIAERLATKFPEQPDYANLVSTIRTQPQELPKDDASDKTRE